MMVSTQKLFGNRWVSITPDKQMFHVCHMYMDHIWSFETLGM